MKNIHILPTDKPSRLYEWGRKELKFTDHPITNKRIWCQNIYITSDEEIKDGDYVLSDTSVGALYLDGEINTASMLAEGQWKKVVLTTDQDLIGVQAIDDEFLEWFVKNPSCEFVEVESVEVEDYVGFAGHTSYPTFHIEYKIIIPKQEPKQDEIMERFIANAKQQETLEEAAERLTYNDMLSWENALSKASFIIGAKWQQERSYSEEEMRECYEFAIENVQLGRNGYEWVTFDEWFEQFKKK